MAGQSANLSKKEACAMQERIQASGSQARKSSSTSSGDSIHRKKQPKVEK